MLAMSATMMAMILMLARVVMRGTSASAGGLQGQGTVFCRGADGKAWVDKPVIVVDE